MDRYWLLTWTTYGTWLPGDRRGFVSDRRSADGDKIVNNRPGLEYDRDDVGLRRYARFRMKGEPVLLSVEQASELSEQFRETASHRGWQLLALAIMANHAHVVLGVPGDHDPAHLLRDLKSYGSRRMNRLVGKPKSGTWWTESGSRRKLPDEEAVLAAIAYVERQTNPLVVWSWNEPASGPA